jgi:hypothetical protein
MFGRSKPVVFDPYRRQRRGRIPGWVWLLLAGITVGALAVIGVQERLLPPRLSAGESSALRQSYAQADTDRTRLQAALSEAQQALKAATAERDRLQAEHSRLSAQIEQQQPLIDFLVDALPPDPRGGAVAVRGARFVNRQGVLQYALALSREGGDSRPLAATLQLRVTGETAGGTERTAELQPVALSLPGRAVALGQVPLPGGLSPRQVTVRVLDKDGKRPLGMRVLVVR